MHDSSPLVTAALAAWQPPATWWHIDTIDAHTAGEPFRVVVAGYPEPGGDTMLDRRRYIATHYDHLRRALMLEPRGHADMYGCIVTTPATPDGHLGVLFMHNEGYSTMCGHGIIGLATVLVEAGYFGETIPDPIRIDAPAGRIDARVVFDGERVRRVTFRNVASYAALLGGAVDVEGLGRVRFDIGFGGAYYAYVDAASIGLACRPERIQELIDAGKRIKRAVAAAHPIVHPEAEDMGFLYGVIFTGPAETAERHSRHVCVFAEGEVDRSPTGTGVSGRLAILHARGELYLHETVRIESVVGSEFSGSIVATESFGGHDAVIPEVSGSASITGKHQFLIDPEDPFREGFLLR